MSTSLRVLLIALVSFIGVLAVFGIALGVAEWRLPDDNSKLIAALESEISSLENDLRDLKRDSSGLDSRLSIIETPPPIADRDIEELYARSDYSSCVFDANILLDDAVSTKNDTYAAYLADNATYDEYLADEDAYQREYDRYDADLDSCFDTYADESPYE